MKKKLALFMTVIMVLSILCTGCSKSKQANSDAASGKGTLTAAGQYPIVKDKITLKVFIPESPQIQDFKTNEFTKFLEEKTNIHIEFQTAPQDSLDEKTNLIMTSGNLPDIFLNCSIDDTKYGVDQKVLMAVDDKIDANMPNFKKFMESQPNLKGSITATDGKIYGLPGWNDCYHCTNPQKMWINTMWLDKLGIKMPTTTEEFYQALKTFKQKVPNGIPLIGSTDGWRANIDSFIMNSFVFDSGKNKQEEERLYLSVNDKKIDSAVNKPGYKDGLAYLNKLYKEGLIYSGSLTQKNDQVKQIMASKGEPVFCSVGGANVNWIDSASTPELYKHYVTLAPLTGPSGLRQSTYLKYDALVPNQFVITKNCKYPEAALRWADFFYSLEGENDEEIGPKGDANWTDAASGDKGLDGSQALFIRKRAYSNEPQNVNWQDTGITFKTSEIRLGEKTDQNVDKWSAAGLEKFLFDETKNNYVPYQSKEFEVTPYLKLTPEETQELQTIKVELNKYIAESRTRFITGDLNVDKDWDSYVKNLDNIGLQKYISTQQKAYDRQFGNK